MKQITKLMIVAASAAALVSCTKEKDLEPVVTPSEGIQINVIADMPEMDSATKTELNADKSVSWQSTDKVGFINGEDGVNVESSAAVLDAEGRATFTASVPSEGTYHAYYPYYGNYTSTAGTKGVAVRNGSGENSQHQHPALTSFDPASDILISEPFQVSASGSYSTDPTALRFRRLGAFIKLTFVDNTTGHVLSEDYATEISVQGPARLVGKAWVSENGLEVESGYMKVIADYDANTFALSSHSAWFGVFPQTFAEGSQIIVSFTTNKRTFEKTLTLPKEVVLGAGNVLPIKVTLNDADVLSVKVEKLWELLAPDSSTSWMQHYLNAGAENDRNVAIDGTNVYIAKFANNATDKDLYAINIANTTTGNPSYSTLPVGTVTTDGIRALTCPRVIKKANGDPVLMVSQLSNTAGTMNLYVYDNDGGINADPRVVSLSRQYSSQRLGDTFSVWGTYEKCMLFFHGMDGNGFVTFPFANGLSATSARLTGRLNTSELKDPAVSGSGFSAYYPYPDNVAAGIAVNRSFGRYWGIGTDSNLWEAEGAIPIYSSRLEGIWDGVNTNAGTNGYNFVEFLGKRYVIYACRDADNNYGKSYLVIKKGELTDSWLSICNKGISQTICLDSLSSNGKTSGNGSGLDVAVWQENSQILIALDMEDVGLRVYRLYAE